MRGSWDGGTFNSVASINLNSRPNMIEETDHDFESLQLFARPSGKCETPILVNLISKIWRKIKATMSISNLRLLWFCM